MKFLPNFRQKQTLVFIKTPARAIIRFLITKIAIKGAEKKSGAVGYQYRVSYDKYLLYLSRIIDNLALGTLLDVL